MTQSHRVKEQLIAHLTSKFGVDRKHAAVAWEEYLLHILAKRICREPAGLHIEDN